MLGGLPVPMAATARQSTPDTTLVVRPHMPYMRKWRRQLAATALHDVDPNLGWILGVLSKMDDQLYLRDQQHK